MLGFRRIVGLALGAWGLCVVACSNDSRSLGRFSGGETGVTSVGEDAGADEDGGQDDGVTASGTQSGGDGDGDGDGGPKFDVANGGTAGDDGGSGNGCEKVDFLFIVDNSGSMSDEQMNLVNSFPGFISTIEQTLMAQDYHLMVLDTDAESLSFSSISCSNNVCTCMPTPQCCFALCNGLGGVVISPPPTSCGGQDCSNFTTLPTGCDVELGAGKVKDPLDNDCNFSSGNRWMTDQEPNLQSAFECAALVGAGGDGNERPMEALTEAIGPQQGMGACNEGFLRDDAILVVTFITDEEDGGSMGDPNTWKQAVIDAKNGDETAVVVLGLVGDSDVAGGTCTSGQPAPKLRQFADSFTQGQWGSVCAPDYTPFFQQAVSVIDAACDNFTPPG